MGTIPSKTINIAIPGALLKKVDALAKRDYTSRSDVIRQALLEKVRRTHSKTDEWGDPIGQWKTLLDFREINPNGVPAAEVLEALKKAAKQDELDDRQNR